MGAFVGRPHPWQVRKAVELAMASDKQRHERAMVQQSVDGTKVPPPMSMQGFADFLLVKIANFLGDQSMLDNYNDGLAQGGWDQWCPKDSDTLKQVMEWREKELRVAHI